MKKAALLGCAAVLSAIGWAKADPVDLSAYVDANGFIDVQALTCAQLANTYQSDANVLMAWYSGWYNGLGHKHYMDYKKGRELEHLVIEYCKAHQDEKIIHAIAVNLQRHARRRHDAREVSGGLHEKSASIDGALRCGADLFGERGERPANGDLSVRGAGGTRVPVRRANRGSPRWLSRCLRASERRCRGSRRTPTNTASATRARSRPTAKRPSWTIGAWAPGSTSIQGSIPRMKSRTIVLRPTCDNGTVGVFRASPGTN